MGLLRSPRSALLLAATALVASTACGGKLAGSGGTGATGGTDDDRIVDVWLDDDDTNEPGRDPVHPGAGTGFPGTEEPDAAVDAGPFTPGDVPTSLEAVRDRMVGRWVGVASTRWRPPYGVELTFGAEGRFGGPYTSRCLDPGGCVALYWGDNGAGGGRTFDLRGLVVDGTVSGKIGIVFEPGNRIEGAIEKLAFDTTGDRLRFEVWNGEYGPVAMDLHRAP